MERRLCRWPSYCCRRILTKSLNLHIKQGGWQAEQYQRQKTTDTTNEWEFFNDIFLR